MSDRRRATHGRLLSLVAAALRWHQVTITAGRGGRGDDGLRGKVDEGEGALCAAWPWRAPRRHTPKGGSSGSVFNEPPLPGQPGRPACWAQDGQVGERPGRGAAPERGRAPFFCPQTVRATKPPRAVSRRWWRRVAGVCSLAHRWHTPPPCRLSRHLGGGRRTRARGEPPLALLCGKRALCWRLMEAGQGHHVACQQKATTGRGSTGQATGHRRRRASRMGLINLYTIEQLHTRGGVWTSIVVGEHERSRYAGSRIVSRLHWEMPDVSDSPPSSLPLACCCLHQGKFSRW